MDIRAIIGAAALAAGLTACEGNGTRVTNETAVVNEPAAAPAATHSASGTVKLISGNSVTIDHGPVESVGWPAMTMSFEAQDLTLLEGVKVGDQVRFEFRQEGGSSRLTSISKQ